MKTTVAFYAEAVPLSLKRFCVSWVGEVCSVELMRCGNKKASLELGEQYLARTHPRPLH